MLDPNLLRNEPDAVAEKLARRGFKLDVDKLGAPFGSGCMFGMISRRLPG